LQKNNCYFSEGWAGIISDTHIPKRAQCLPSAIFDYFEGASLILHAGDIVEEKVITELEAIAPVVAVSGNMDSFNLYQKFGEENVVYFNSKKVGLVHGKGRGNITKEWVYNLFSKRNYDGAVFGHLHQPVFEYRGNFLLFNPGSPTNPRGAPASCGKIWEKDGKLNAELFYLNNF